MEMPHLVYVYCRTHHGRQRFLFFSLPSFLFPPFRHVMLAHFHPLAVSTGSSYQARFKQLEGKETHFHSPVFMSFMCKFTSHSSNNWKINI